MNASINMNNNNKYVSENICVLKEQEKNTEMQMHRLIHTGIVRKYVIINFGIMNLCKINFDII